MIAKIDPFLVGLCLLAIVATSESAKSKYQLNNPECTAKYQHKTDMAVARLMGYGPLGRKFPETNQQLAAFCRETTVIVDQIYAYFTKCYKREIRDTANVLLYSVRRNIRTFCRKKTKKLTKLMDATACLNKGIHDDTCLMRFANNTRQLIPLKMDDPMKISHACW